ncbi:kinase-like domain-containing protein [Lasiosphaeria hispida]|uniref:Autophagy-related protein 1 n=1 Tax=Lasiosphaeria hispida TaxID=260671 RepID=A0AAJ0HC55_9PEZI|nr:kinase-like domain-containing protein [Lasiosphaeria hispida]
MSVKNWNNFSAASAPILEQMGRGLPPTLFKTLKDTKWEASVVQSTPDDDQPITTQSRIQITEGWQRQSSLGKGTFGQVFQERCISGGAGTVGKLRAVKTISALEASAAGNEFALQARLSEPKCEAFFVKSTGWFAAGVDLTLAMECLPAGDLGGYLMHNQQLSEEEGVAVARQMLQAVAFMHDLGITHNDIKPGNILVKSSPATGGEWWIKIADFGHSKLHANTMARRSLRTLGTPGYMAPEMHGLVKSTETSFLRKQKKTDMWAVGVTIFEMLTCATCFSSLDHVKEYIDTGPVAFLDNRLNKRGLSADGKDFLHALLYPLDTQRPHADEALADPWIAGRIVTQFGYQHTIQLTNEHVCSLSLSNNNNRMLIVTPSRLHSVSTSNPNDFITHASTSTESFTAAAISPDGQFATAIDTCGTLYRFEFPGLNLIETQALGFGEVKMAERMLAYSQTGQRLAVTCNNQLTVLDLHGSAFSKVSRLSHMAIDTTIQAVEFHAGDQHILVGSADGLRVFSLQSQKPQCISFAPSPVADVRVSISPRGARAVAIGQGGIYMRQPGWTCWRRQYACDNETGPAVFSPDGSTFAISDECDKGGILLHGSASLNDVWDTWFKEDDFSHDRPMTIALSNSLVVTAYQSAYEPDTAMIVTRRIDRDTPQRSP